MKRIVVALGAAVGIFVFLVVVSLTVGRPPSRSPTAGEQSHSEVAGESVQPEAAASVAPRRADPAGIPVIVREPSEDPQLLEKLADEAEDIFGLQLAEPDMYAGYVGWSSGYADDSEFGEHVRQCVREWEGEQTAPCLWERDIVLKRTGSGMGKVVFARVRPRGDHGWTSACRAVVTCLQDAWKGRLGPMPDTTDEYFAFTTDSNPPLLASGHKGQQALDVYEAGVLELEEAIAAMDLPPDHPGYAAQERNRRLYSSMLEHARQMLDDR